MVTVELVWKWLEEVFDPEVPVLTVVDLGVIRNVVVNDDNSVIVTITPTYSGCPAMDKIANDVQSKIAENGYRNCKIETVLYPSWTTDWITEKGKQKLKEFGIAPPENEVDKNNLFSKSVTVPCPKCNSQDTKMISLFGSTACKAHYQCNSCKEPFDYFKCLR